MNKNVSFVIPAYNCQSTLEEAVDSIFNDNFQPGDEVIIVNDASTDKTSEISKNLLTKYEPFIKLINNERNLGCPASRNIGISVSKNDLIFNLDSDNVLSPNSICRLRDEMNKEGADVASFQEYHYFKTDTKEITHKWRCIEGVMKLEDFLSGSINPGPGGNFLYRKEIWKKIGGYWEYGKGLHEAWGFSLKLLVNGAKFIVVPNTYYFHRYSHNSLFVRESSKGGEGEKITNDFIKLLLNFLDEDTLKYIKRVPNWFELMEKRPLCLRSKKQGHNGKIIYTSLIKQIAYFVKKIIMLS